MCTALTVTTAHKDILFGRTMDFSHPLEPSIIYIPKGYRWNNILDTHVITAKYNIMGIGQNISPITFADGVNDKGFAIAALYFPDFAHFDKNNMHDNKYPTFAASEIVKLMLNLCADVEQACKVFKKIHIIGVKDAVTGTIAPLHWIMNDQRGHCKVVEKTIDGLHIYDNAIGILTNSPDFNWHKENLRNYMNLSPRQTAETNWDGNTLTPFGQGGGTFGLPGDFTPPSRFVRAAFLKSHALFPAEIKQAVNTCYHITNNLSIPKGVVITERDSYDYTQYTCFIDLNTCDYYYNTYDNPQIQKVSMPENNESNMGITILASFDN